MKRSF